MAAQNKKNDSSKTPLTKDQNTIFIASGFPRAMDFRIPDNSGVDRRIIIEGNAAHLRGKDKGVLPIGGYGLTAVEPEVWNEIKDKYKFLPVIQNGLIFAVEGDKRFAEDAIAERKDIRHGYEPIDPTKTMTKESKQSEIQE